ncbi:sigma-70 family RNA polymerase sigma factor [Amycolatopsis roodepoortensis]|uniref:RNA polymerase sigma-70 factor (ECF subfamily) n=1 Tax=Amycolatopsis roodepoortensis TaxID=700274 RepID=A0ABR9LIB6_9PSEU|nr:sigma-70 family RNA polymerase sigma factor [Amycolatopsis roodepoortensis]MBE1580430.1 RNA polymerase sigma-70 factor (ECF subfamily) [Amycolatopsis roodepoortensis]
MPGISFEAFFADDFPRLAGFLISLGYESALAEDAAAEAMYKAHENWGSIDHPGSWVRTVAKREAMNQAIRDQDGIKKAVQGGWVPPKQSPEDPPRIVEARLRRQEMLKTLPDQQREVMAWTFDGFEPIEIANALGVAPDTVRSNLRHARTKLKKLYTQQNQQAEGGA